MTTMEFEGKNEREAVAKAAEELGSESFDVEILEKSTGLFGRGKVKIRVKPLTSIPDPLASGNAGQKAPAASKSGSKVNPQVEEPKVNEPIDPPSDEIIEKETAFLEELVRHMGYSGSFALSSQDGGKLIFELASDSSGILIGKKGKNLDALQLLANVYLNRITGEDSPWRVVLDSEGYRSRREESLVRMAHRVADEAARTRSTRLLEPLNPFERRLVHTSIGEREDVYTKSEGDGLYKRIRILAKNGSRNRPRNRR